MTIEIDLQPYLVEVQDDALAGDWLSKQGVYENLMAIAPTGPGSVRLMRFHQSLETTLTFMLCLHFHSNPKPEDNGFMLIGFAGVPDDANHRAVCALQMTQIEMAIRAQIGGDEVSESEITALWKLN